MAIFDRSYDRDYGNRAGNPYRGQDRDTGDRVEGSVRRGWNRVTNETHDAFQRDEDRGYGYRGGAYGASAYDTDYENIGYGGSHGPGVPGGNWQRRGYNRLEGEDRGYNRDSSWYAGRGMGVGGDWNYDRDYERGATFGAEDRDAARYDRNFKSRWETDHGDPFGDRTRGTPIRVLRGGFRGREGRYDRGMRYDRDFGAGGRGYDRDMMGRGGMDRSRGYMRGTGYDPYEDRSDRSFRGGRSDYDRGWF